MSYCVAGRLLCAGTVAGRRQAGQRPGSHRIRTQHADRAASKTLAGRLAQTQSLPAWPTSSPPACCSARLQNWLQTDVNGPNAEPLFTYLKTQQGGLLGSDIKWNFT